MMPYSSYLGIYITRASGHSKRLLPWSQRRSSSVRILSQQCFILVSQFNPSAVHSRLVHLASHWVSRPEVPSSLIVDFNIIVELSLPPSDSLIQLLFAPVVIEVPS